MSMYGCVQQCLDSALFFGETGPSLLTFYFWSACVSVIAEDRINVACPMPPSHFLFLGCYKSLYLLGPCVIVCVYV